jgi:hypothetical protein
LPFFGDDVNEFFDKNLRESDSCEPGIIVPPEPKLRANALNGFNGNCGSTADSIICIDNGDLAAVKMTLKRAWR